MWVGKFISTSTRADKTINGFTHIHRDRPGQNLQVVTLHTLLHATMKIRNTSSNDLSDTSIVILAIEITTLALDE
jgi:hypothetical protein